MNWLVVGAANIVYFGTGVCGCQGQAVVAKGCLQYMLVYAFLGERIWPIPGVIVVCHSDYYGLRV